MKKLSVVFVVIMLVVVFVNQPPLVAIAGQALPIKAKVKTNNSLLDSMKKMQKELDAVNYQSDSKLVELEYQQLLLNK